MSSYSPKFYNNGIEGDDLPYHLFVLGLDPVAFRSGVVFYPLVDHYNCHDQEWNQQIDNLAQQAHTVVFYDLVNTGDYEHGKFCDFVSNYNHARRVYLTVNQSTNLKIANVEIVPWDFMWNRFKLYYSQPVPWDKLVLHHYAGPDRYTVPDLDFSAQRSKKFLSMCGREYGWRKNLFEALIGRTDGYVSCRSRGITIEPEDIRGAFSPVPGRYYLDCYLSIYVESNCVRNDLIHITEKTYEPLLKGHFILPFSNPGTVAQLKEYGFRFPDFIDYSFDEQTDTSQRFNMLMIEFERLMKENLQKRYIENKELILHNQRVFFERDYDRRIQRLYEL